MGFSVALSPTGWWKADELKVFGLVRVRERKWTFVEALDKVNFSLVLPGFGSLNGPTLPAEGHVPAFVFSILEGGVVVLQHNLCEDAVPSPAIGLAHQFPPAVHTQVSATLCSFDPDTTSKRVCLHIKSRESVAVLRRGAHSLPLDLHMSAARSAVQLVDSDLPPAQLVRQ